MASPVIARADGLAPRIHSITTSQNGSVATRSAAIPDEIRTSAHPSAAYGNPNSNAPAARPGPQSLRAGRSRRSAATPSRSRPAIVQRAPIIRSGGIDPTASRMARKVDPQIR
jgi:hypothetical protein